MHALTGVDRRRADAPAVLEKGSWVPRLWHIWLAASVPLSVMALPRVIHFAPSDPDDYMRLLQVRDWLAGQSWFDVQQYRMNPPLGADMHWSRLVDLPIAAFLVVFRLFLAERPAEIAAMTAVPICQLFVAMVVMRGLLQDLGAAAKTGLAAAALIPLFPLLTSNFLPMRIDHHGWQAVAALACAWLMVRAGYRAAFAAGLVAAAWQTISLEGLPLAVVLAGLFALRYGLWGRREHEAFLGALALGSIALFFATRAAGDITTAHCDQLSWPHFVAFGAAAALAAASRFLPGQTRATLRFASLVPIGLAAGAAIVLPLGACALDPFAGVDPLLRHYWLDNIVEGQPITRQLPSFAAMLLWTIALLVLGALVALQQAERPEQCKRWAFLALFALAAAAMSLLVLRAALAAQLLAVPFAAVLLMHYLPRARALKRVVPRVAGTLACIGLATPVIATAAMKPFDRLSASAASSSTVSATSSAGTCDLDRLNALPRSKLFAPLDLGPEILARTPHSVVMGPYHRNQAKMREVFDVFAGPLGNARAIVQANGTSYLVACTDQARLTVYADAGDDNLADRLLAGRAPAWLEPVTGFERGPLRVFRVR
jgi:hypothetical protein